MTNHPSIQKIFIRKEALKFSSAHMTVFPDGTKENLHGHNFQIELAITTAEQSLDQMIPFHDLKRSLKSICESLDEKILIARKCPFLKIFSQNHESLSFSLCNKTYTLPTDEVVLIDFDNITTENLAKYIALNLIQIIDQKILTKIFHLSLRVDESHGQGAAYEVEFHKQGPKKT